MSKIKIGLLSIVVISSIAIAGPGDANVQNTGIGDDSAAIKNAYSTNANSKSSNTANTATSTNGSGNTINQVMQGVGNFAGTVQSVTNFIQNVTKAYQDLKFGSSKIANLINNGVNIASGLVNEANLDRIIGAYGLNNLDFFKDLKLNWKKIGADKAFCKIDELITKGGDTLKILDNGKKEAEQFLKANFDSFNKNNKQSWDIAGLVDKAMGCKDDQANTKEIDDIAKAKKEILIKNKESREAINRLTHYGDASTKNFLNFLFDNGFVEINATSELGNIIKDIDNKLSEENIGKEQATKLKFTKNGGFSSQDNIVKAKADFTEIHIEMQKAARDGCKNQEGIHDYEYCVKAAKQKLTSQCLESKNSSNSNGNGGDNPNTPNGLPTNPKPGDNQNFKYMSSKDGDNGKCAGYFIDGKSDSDKQKVILTSFAKDLMKDVKTSEEINKMALTDSDKLIEKQKSMQKLKEAEKQLTMMNNLYGMIDEVNNLQLTHAFVSAEPFDEAFSREKIDKITKQAETIAEGMIQALTTKVESR